MIKTKLLYSKKIFISLLFLIIGIFYIEKVNISSLIIIVLTSLVYIISIFILNGFKLPIFNFKKDSQQNNFRLLMFVIIGTIGLYLFNYLIPTVTKIVLFNDIKGNSSYESVSFISIIAIIIIYPFLEELFFRKLITEKLYIKKGFKFALILSATIFSLSHVFSDNGLLGAFLGGLTLGFIYLKTFNLLFCFICHALNNILILILSTRLDYLVFNNNSAIILFTLFIVMILLYYIFIKGINNEFESVKENKKIEKK